MNDLIDRLTRQLGVDTRQAESGVGILFKAVQDKLGRDEFQKLLDAAPGVSDLLRLAPTRGRGGLLGGLASAIGGNAAIVANVVAGFGQLGLSAGMAKKFVPIMVDYLREYVGPDDIARMEAALRA